MFKSKKHVHQFHMIASCNEIINDRQYTHILERCDEYEQINNYTIEGTWTEEQLTRWYGDQ